LELIHDPTRESSPWTIWIPAPTPPEPEVEFSTI